MPATRADRARVLLRTSLPWRRAFGDRTVRRVVQGVPLYLPWSHLLPDYARARPTYGQNLVELAAGLARRDTDPDPDGLVMLDIGANIGDSAVQVLHRVRGRVLCVEADPYWCAYLHRNVDGDERIEVEEVLLTADADEQHEVRAVRAGGTTRYVAEHAAPGAPPTLPVRALRAAHPRFERLRLIKSDTDGFDTRLVVAAARVWRDSAPVLFFEFDPLLTREVAGEEPNAVWAALAELGYEHVAVWDNTGDPLGRLPLAEAREAARSLEPRPVGLGYHFWDVAVCRGDDAAALATLEDLVPTAFDARGTGRPRGTQ
jgi:FkbM family methyltransferase